MINVIFAALGRTSPCPSRVMSIARFPPESNNSEPKRARIEIRSVLDFSDEDKIGTIQPHDNPVVVTHKIRGYDVKRVLVNQGSAIEIMYPDLCRRLKLRPEDLACYDSPLIRFDGKIVFLKDQIRLPI